MKVWLRAACFVFFGVSLCNAQLLPNPDYVLTLTDASGPSGSLQTVQVLLDNTGMALEGLTFGVCHDSNQLSIEQADLGADVLALFTGAPPAFLSPTVLGDGLIASLFFSNSVFGGGSTLPTGTALEVLEITYRLDGPGGTVTPVEFCDQLSGLIAPIEVHPDGSALAELPVTNDGTVTIGIVGPTFTFAVPDVTAAFDAATGQGDFDVTVTVSEDASSPGFPNDTYGLSMSLRHDPLVLVPASADVTGALGTVNGGMGPDFFSVTFESDGLTIGTVYSTGTPVDVLTFATVQDVVALHYDTNSAELQNIITPVNSSLEWGPNGTPPVKNLVGISLAGDTVDAQGQDASVLLLPGGPFLERGDCNTDGSYNIGDALAVLGTAFGTAPPPNCEDACDLNDDGSINVADAVYGLNNLFGNGNDPASPFPNCGTDTTSDSLTCASFPCP